MHPGALVGERFVVERAVGAGGMGAVFQAHDRQTGLKVALKVWNGIGDNAARFEAEGRLLAELRHPAIVRYVAHGTTAAGELYFVMQWLEGVDLAERLAGGGVTVAEAATLIARAAEGLAVAHARGVVHRDIKPSNLFLVEGEPAQVKLLDFGIARARALASETDATPRRPETRTGMLVGTPEYMSPEQARGDRDIDARTDVFALGAVLYECLTGRPAFVAENVMALLARVLLDEVAPVRSLRPEVPEALDALVTRMLAKKREDRPADAAEVAATLAVILGDGAALEGLERPSGARRAASITRGELRLVCIVLACSSGRIEDLEGTAPTLAGAGTPLDPRRLAEVAHAFGARLEPIGDGGVVLTLAGRGTATDQAAHAARCALSVRDTLPDAAVALATGRGSIEQGTSLGPVIDRAVNLLRVALDPEATGAHGGLQPIYVDETTAALLDERFDVAVGMQGIALRAEREAGDGMRTLLGRPTPFVGRERELGLLLDLFDACVHDGTAHAVLVTAGAGVGKSRLRVELVRALRERGEASEIWIGRGDPMRAGAPFGMLAPALRRSAGIVEGEPLDLRRQKLRARVARHLREDDVERVTAFLGELVSVPFEDEESVPLRAARKNATLMGDQVRRAWEDFLAAEAGARPVLIVLEDLHHGDLPTAKLIDTSLRAVREAPWMVLALARPEVHALFPKLWAERGRHEVHLPDLGRRASERIVRHALGDDAREALVARIVERAAGNALFLEELLRAVLERGEGEIDGPLPETVLSIVQARLEALEPEARRVLRAASVFGEAFWAGGVRALLGEAPEPIAVDEWLTELVEREIVGRVADERLAGEIGYAFRSALVRDAAYAMLTDDDRALGHALAAEWLQARGAQDAALVAQHLERGGALPAAIALYRRAAEQARDANDFAAVVGWAERGVGCGARGEPLGELRLLQSEAHNALGENAAAQACAEAAMASLVEGADGWHHAAAELATAAGRVGDAERLGPLVATIRAHVGASVNARLVSLSRAAFSLFAIGRHREAEEVLDAVESLGAALVDVDPIAAARVHSARTTRALWRGDVESLLRLSESAAARFALAGDLRAACTHRVNVGFACMELGQLARAESALRLAVAEADRLGLRTMSAAARHNLGFALCALGGLEEARTVEAEAAALCRAHGDRRLEGGSRVYLATILLRLGELRAAEIEAIAAVEVAATIPDVRAQALAALARIRLAAGRPGDALAAAADAHAILESLGGLDEGESLVRLAWAESLAANGRRDEANRALADAKTRLEARAARIVDPALRASFLASVEDNARTIALHQAGFAG